MNLLNFHKCQLALALTLWSSVSSADAVKSLEVALAASDHAGVMAALAELEDLNNLTIGNSPALVRAAAEASPKVVTAMIEAGVKIDAQDREGFSPLMRAVQFERPEIAEILLTNGADRRLENIWGENAEDIARRTGDFSLALQVADARKNPQRASAALFASARAGDRDGIQQAFDNGADLLWRDAAGRSFLGTALDAQQMEPFRFLASLQRRKSSDLLHADDAKKLIEFGFLYPPDSVDRRFLISALTTLIGSGVISSEEILEALPNDMGSDAKRLILRDLGLPGEMVASIVPSAPSELPPLEYSLPMAKISGEIEGRHWESIQKILKEEGLYQGPIDGIPGTGTFDGLYAYVLGIVPLVIERGKAANLLAQQEAFGYGHMRTTTRASQSGTYLGGRILSDSSGMKIVGYIAASQTSTFEKIHSYSYQFIPVPAFRSEGWTAQSVGVGCEDGIVTRASATVLGSYLSITLKAEHRIQFSGAAGYKHGRDVPGKAPKISC